jgi:hypothetical protein
MEVARRSKLIRLAHPAPARRSHAGVQLPGDFAPVVARIATSERLRYILLVYDWLTADSKVAQCSEREKTR